MKLVIFFLLVGISVSAQGRQEIGLNWSYDNVSSGERVKLTDQLDLPLSAFDTKYVSHREIQKTLFLVDLGTAVVKSIKDVEEGCQVPHRENCLYPPSCIPPVDRECSEVTSKVSKGLLAKLFTLRSRLTNQLHFVKDKSVADTLELFEKLPKIIEKYKPEPVFRHPRGVRNAAPNMSSGGLGVTVGGGQDFSFFRKRVEDGHLPASSSFHMEGYLSEYDLSLASDECKDLICAFSGVALYPEQKKAYIQVSMNSKVTPEMFSRSPLNLSVVLDVSGSMSATDATEKTRLAWSKETLKGILKQLNSEDFISIVIFNENSSVLIPTTSVEDTDDIFVEVEKLLTGGTTNLESGLRLGYELVSANLKSGYENRVILLSDAGLNTGTTDDASLLKLITDYSSEGIGLTAIGLGDNFNDRFIHKITMSRGGNYIFVHSGEKMLDLISNFNYLVTPVAYNFKVDLKLDSKTYKFVKAYGVPKFSSDESRTLIDVQTLFFSTTGGAILLEYDLL